MVFGSGHVEMKHEDGQDESEGGTHDVDERWILHSLR